LKQSSRLPTRLSDVPLMEALLRDQQYAPVGKAAVASRGTSKSHARGQFKTARLERSDYCRKRWLGGRLRLPIAGSKAVLVEPVALASNLDKVRVMHQPIEKGHNRRRVAEKLWPILEGSV
jgi:hypothetical protein